MVPRAFLSAGDGPASARSAPSPTRGDEPDAAGGAGKFLRDFIGGGGKMRTVPKNYFATRLAEIDAGANYGGKPTTKVAELAASMWLGTLQDRAAARGS